MSTSTLEPTTATVTQSEADNLLTSLRGSNAEARYHLGAWHKTLVTIHTTRSFLLSGFTSWSDFVDRELGMERSAANRLVLKGATLTMLDAAGVKVKPSAVSGNAARRLARNPRAADEIRAAVEAGVEPAVAVREAANAGRAVTSVPVVAESRPVESEVIGRSGSAEVGSGGVSVEGSSTPEPTEADRVLVDQALVDLKPPVESFVGLSDAEALTDEEHAAFLATINGTEPNPAGASDVQCENGSKEKDSASVPADTEDRPADAAGETKRAITALILLVENCDLMDLGRRLSADQAATLRCAFDVMMSAFDEAHTKPKTARKATTVKPKPAPVAPKVAAPLSRREVEPQFKTPRAPKK
jgi:hypothetical protein